MQADGNDLVISAAFDGPMKSLTYRLKPNGWLSIDYVYAISGPQEYFGVGFDYPEADVKGMRFLGEGPAPVYQNRLAGGTLDVWNRPYNNTMVGDPDDLKPGEHFDYPLFKGFYSGVRWLQLNTSEGPITAMVDQHPDSPIYVQIFTPKTPPAKPGRADWRAVPECRNLLPARHPGNRQQVRRPAIQWPHGPAGDRQRGVQGPHQPVLWNDPVRGAAHLVAFFTDAQGWSLAEEHSTGEDGDSRCR